MITQQNTLSTIATDPLRNFKFVVNLLPPTGAPIAMSFMTCSGLSETTDTIPYREGTFNTTSQKMAGQTDFGPLTFTKGVMVGTQVQVNWITQIFVVQGGSGTSNSGTNYRENIQVLVLDHPVTSSQVAVKAAFTIFNAWPTALAYSDLDAGANQLLISQMTLTHEGFVPSLASSAGATEASYSSPQSTS